MSMTRRCLAVVPLLLAEAALPPRPEEVRLARAEAHEGVGQLAKMRIKNLLHEQADIQEVLKTLRTSDRHFSSSLMNHISMGASGRQVPGMILGGPPMEDDTDDDDAATPKTQQRSHSSLIATDTMGLIDQLLDALGSDDFVRNFTKMSGLIEDLAGDLKGETSRVWTAFQKDTANKTGADMKQPIDDLLTKHRIMGLDLLVGIGGIFSNFTQEVPAGLLKGTPEVPDITKTSVENAANVTEFANLMRQLPRANMSKVDHHVYCRIFHLVEKAAVVARQTNKGILVQINSSRRMMPTMARTFSTMLPPDDEESQAMAPRLLFIIGQLLDYMFSLVSASDEFETMMNGQAVPYSFDRLGCATRLELDQEHDQKELERKDLKRRMKEVKKSGAPRLGFHLLSVVACALSSWLLL